MGNQEEIWKGIVGYEGFYQVSNYGRVKSLSIDKKMPLRVVKSKERIKKLRLDKDGYLLCDLNKNKKRTTNKIHRLVAKAFITNPENKSEVNHKNGVKNDNSFENLEWCTRSENEKHAFAILGKKSNLIRNKK